MPKRRLKKYKEGSTLDSMWGGIKDATMFGADVGMSTLVPFMKTDFMDDHYTHDFSKKAAGSFSDMSHAATAGVTEGVIRGFTGADMELDSYRSRAGRDQFKHGAADFGAGSVEGAQSGSAAGPWGALAGAAIGGYQGVSEGEDIRATQNMQNRTQNSWASPYRTAKYGGRLKKLQSGGNISGDPQKGVYVDYNVGQSHSGPDEGIEVDAMGQPVATSGGEGVGLTEKGEVTFNGDVFSASVKLPGNKKRTFADEAKRISRKYKFYLGEKLDKQDEASKLGLQKELQTLFDIQEAKKGRMMHESEVEQLMQEQQQAQAEMVQQEQMAEQQMGQEQMMQDPAMQEQMAMEQQMGGGMPMMQEGGELDSLKNRVNENAAMVSARSATPKYDLYPASRVPRSRLGEWLTGKRYRKSMPLTHRISNMINEPIQRNKIEKSREANRVNQLIDLEQIEGGTKEEIARKTAQVEDIERRSSNEWGLPKHNNENPLFDPSKNRGVTGWPIPNSTEEFKDSAVIGYERGLPKHNGGNTLNLGNPIWAEDFEDKEYPWAITPTLVDRGQGTQKIDKSSKESEGTGYEDASPDYMSTLLSGAASAIKPIAGLIYNKRNKPDPIRLPRVSPELTSEALIRQGIEEDSRVARSSATRNIAKSGATSGGLAAASGSIASNILRGKSRADAESYTRENQRNAQERARVQAINAQMNMQEKMFNAQLDRMDEQEKKALWANLAGIPQNTLADIRDQEQFYAGLNMQHPDLRYAQEANQPWWKRRRYSARAIGPDGSIQ